MAKVKLLAGPFAGFEAEVLEDLGSQLRVSVSLFGKPSMQTVERSAVAFPVTHDSLRAQLESDEVRHWREAQRIFWADRAGVPGTDARQDWEAFQAWLAGATTQSQARTAQRLADFERELRGIPAEEAQARVQSEPERWGSPRHRETSHEEHDAGRRRREAGEAAGAILELLGPSDAERWAEAARMLERWDELEEELSFPAALSGEKMRVKDVKLSAYVGSRSDYRLVFELLHANQSSGSGGNQVVVIAPAGPSTRQLFHDFEAREPDSEPNRAQQCWAVEGHQELRLTPTYNDVRLAGVNITASDYDANVPLTAEQVACVNLHVRKEHQWLADPPTELAFPAGAAPWQRVWTDRGLHIVDHVHLGLTNPSAARTPSSTAYYRALAVALARGKATAPPAAADPLQQLLQAAWSRGGKLQGAALAQAVTQLDLSGRADVASLAACADLSELKALYVPGTNVSDLEPLRHLSKLTDLSLASTLITRLEPLSGLMGLEKLDVSRTGVTDLSPLLGLKGLRMLTVSPGFGEASFEALRANGVNIQVR